MARIAFAAVFTALSLLLNGCGRGDDQRWGGFALGQSAPMDAYDPIRSPVGADGLRPPHFLSLQHALVMPNTPEFPWQEAFAQIDTQGRVIAVTLSTACCGESLVDMDTAPSSEAVRALASAERQVPDRFAENVRPPRYRFANLEGTARFISAGDMAAYGKAALKQAIARLGAPTRKAMEPVSGMFALSYLEDLKALRVHWARMGPAGPKDFAVLDIGKTGICLTIAAAGDRQLPVHSGCGGLDLSCYDQFYPAKAPGGQSPDEYSPGEIEDCRKL